MKTLKEAGAVRVEEKIVVLKQLSHYEDVIAEIKGNGEIQVEKREKEKEGDKNDTSSEKNHKANYYDLGFLLSVFIKGIFRCLDENKQIGKN